jgi:hypothetical protein
MEDQEIRERYGLKGKRHAIILFITMLLLIMAIVVDIMVIINPAEPLAMLFNGIDIICCLFLVIYAIYGYKLPIISFQIVVAVRAIMALNLLNFFIHYKEGSFSLIIDGSGLVLLLIFLFTMKNYQTVAKASIVAVCLLCVVPMVMDSLLGKFKVGSLSPLVVSIAIAVIYFSRIARKEVRESKEA